MSRCQVTLGFLQSIKIIQLKEKPQKLGFHKIPVKWGSDPNVYKYDDGVPQNIELVWLYK